MIQLYPHQEDAVAWMKTTENRMRMVPDQPHGGILAHAMGLGKTISMLSLILSQPAGVTLIVCPKSLLMQWTNEAKLVGFVSDKIVVYHGPERKLHRAPFTPGTLVLTTFDIVRIEFRTTGIRTLHTTRWDRVVLDEAHRICEQSSKTSRAIQCLNARNRWCITGTPFKNNISDLMALSRFLMIGPYSNPSWWRLFGQSPTKLREWRTLFLHMRGKTELVDLPPVTYHNIKVVLSPCERSIYESLGKAAWKPREGDYIDEPKEIVKHDQHELLMILRQRQATNHPLLMWSDASVKRHQSGEARVCVGCGVESTGRCASNGAHNLCATCQEEPMCSGCIVSDLKVDVPAGGWVHSAKTRALWTYLCDTAQILSSPTKVVLFSQWTSSLDIVGELLDWGGVGFERYDGRVNTTDERESVIRKFRDSPDCKVLLTSLGAGGEGVNLTFASHVILMEPYWNLAVEQQAVDRLHRIGQKNVTHVARFVVSDTIEEWVQDIQEKKSTEQQRVLFDSVVSSDKASARELFSKSCGAGKMRARFELDTPNEERSGGLGAFLRSAKRIKV